MTDLTALCADAVGVTVAAPVVDPITDVVARESRETEALMKGSPGWHTEAFDWGNELFGGTTYLWFNDEETK